MNVQVVKFYNIRLTIGGELNRKLIRLDFEVT